MYKVDLQRFPAMCSTEDRRIHSGGQSFDNATEGVQGVFFSGKKVPKLSRGKCKTKQNPSPSTALFPNCFEWESTDFSWHPSKHPGSLSFVIKLRILLFGVKNCIWIYLMEEGKVILALFIVYLSC